MIPANLQSFGVLVPTAGTPVALSTGAKFPGVLATMLTLWPGKGANGRTVNTGIIYVGFGNAVAPQLGVPEQATGNLAGSVTAAGNASVVVTSAFLAGSPITVPVPVLNGDTPTAYAAKVAAALNANAVFNQAFVASNATIVLKITRNPNLSGEDASLLFTVSTGTAVGITTVSSTITTVDVPATITPPAVWIPLAAAPTVPLQIFPDLIAGGLDLSMIFVDAATSGDGIVVLAVSDPIR